MRVSGLTALSRVAGFVRDILTASILGAGPVADAFFVALKLPNLFRRITAEGAFSVSFIPLFTQTLTQEGKAKSEEFAGQILSLMLLVLSLFTLICLMLMPWIIHLIAPGFDDGDMRHDMATQMTRITFPYLLMMSIAALMGGILNALDRFAPFAFAPVLFNLSLIGALLCAGLAQTAGHAMAWGVCVAGVLQIAWLGLCLRRQKFKLTPRRLSLNPKIRKVFCLMGPGVLGAGVMQINLFADMIIASMVGTGAISALYYADRLVQLPLGMVGIAVGTALLPMLARAHSEQNSTQATDLFNRALEYCLLLALPAAIGLMVIAQPLVITLFYHGAFTAQAAHMSINAITAYAFGLPAYIAIKVFATAFWARQDTKRPVLIAIIATLLNITLSLWLAIGLEMGILGIAIGTACAGWVQIALFSFFLFGKKTREKEHIPLSSLSESTSKADSESEIKHKLDERLRTQSLKIGLACTLMGGVLWMTHFTPLWDVYQYSVDLPKQGKTQQTLILCALIGSGIALYASVLLATHAIQIKELRNFLQRPKQIPKQT